MHIITETDRDSMKGLLSTSIGQLYMMNELIYVEDMLNVTIPLMKLIVSGEVAAVSDEIWSDISENYWDEWNRVRESYKRLYTSEQYVPFGVVASGNSDHNKRPLTTECENTGETVRLVFKPLPRIPYRLVVECPSCGDRWHETMTEAEATRILEAQARVTA